MDAVVAKPLIYNGSLTTYASWRRLISLYMTVNQTKFHDDNTKIACALSYMTEGTASTWAQAFFEEKNATGTFAPGTWADFTTRLDSTFKDINLQKKAAKLLLEGELSICYDNTLFFPFILSCYWLSFLVIFPYLISMHLSY